MNSNKIDPKSNTSKELNDIRPISDDNLDAVHGAGNPWDDQKGVPQRPIDEDIRDRV